jgi:hypothetical protein
VNPPYSGGCLCGAVRYRVNSEPETLYACHCTDCQRRVGTAFALSLVVRRDALELTRGETVPYSAKLPDGRQKNGQLCATCSTRLWGESVRNPAFVIVQPGTLDDTSWLRPVAHIWTRSAQPWIRFPEGAALFETQPPEPWKVLFQLWRER